MQVAIDVADRKLLIVAGTLFFLLLGAVAFFTPPSEQNEGAMPSTYSSAPAGARAAYLLLEDLHYDVRRWESPPTELPSGVSNVVLIIADPFATPDSHEHAALERFVRGGGRLLITGPLVGDFLSGAALLPEESGGDTQYGDVMPSMFTEGAPTIVLHAEGLWRAVSPSQLALYGNPDHPAVVSWSLGAGRVLWWAGPDPLTNAGIARQQNLNLFLDAVTAPLGSSGERPAIYWDEYYHGERASLWGYVQNTPVAWGIVQILILSAILFFTFGRRAGPLVSPFTEPRLWPLEFVDTLGSLYERAGAAPAAVGVVYRHFRSALSRRLRIPLTASETALAQAVEANLGWNASTLAHTLRAAAAAGETGKLRPAEALAMIQELEYYEDKLGLKKRPEGRP